MTQAVYSKIIGGLGNQLSAFACAYSLAQLTGRKLVLDISDYFNGYARPYVLDHLNIPLCEKLVYAHESGQVFGANSFPSALAELVDYAVTETPEFRRIDDLVTLSRNHRSIYLNGYWAKHSFFSGFESEIREFYTPLYPSSAYLQFKTQIKYERSVAVHVRRTDFVELNNPCGVDYYKAAIVYLKARYPDCKFYFFSDDIDFTKETFGNKEEFRFIQILGGVYGDLDEFFCISACSHRILQCGSSFSAWSSFLNSQPGNLDVIYEPTSSVASEGLIGLNECQVADLLPSYAPKARFLVQDISSVNTVLEEFCEENLHLAAKTLIDRICLDAFSLKRSDWLRLLFCKANAHFRLEEIERAEQCLHRQAQFSSGDAHFHALYHLVLKAQGKSSLSAVHGARCANLTQDQSLRDALDITFQSGQGVNDLYDSVRHASLKHFIIIPNTSWHLYVRTPQSIAVWLARMGHSVSYINPPTVGQLSNDVPTEIVIQSCYSSRKIGDSIYSYGVDLYPSYLNRSSPEQATSYIHALAAYIGLNGQGTPIQIFRHPYALGAPQGQQHQMIYWDFDDESDSERGMVSTWDIATRRQMSLNADQVVTSNENFLQIASKQWGAENIHLHNSKEFRVKDFEILSKRVPYTDNFLADDHHAGLACLFLKLASITPPSET